MLIYVTVASLIDRTILKEKVALHIESIEEAEDTALQFAVEVSENMNVEYVNYKIYVEINNKFYELVEEE